MLSAATRTTRTSALGLVLANLLPVVGVLALGWSPFTVVMAYVLETVIVGLYAWLRILLAQQTPLGARIGVAMFFTAHYGIFLLVQSVFLVIALGADDAWSPDVQRELAIAGLGFLVSHGISFATHYLGGGEFRQADARVELFRPYLRVFVQQVVAILGFWIALTLGGARIGPVLALVACKLLLDLRAHLRLHADDTPRAPLPG